MNADGWISKLILVFIAFSRRRFLICSEYATADSPHSNLIVGVEEESVYFITLWFEASFLEETVETTIPVAKCWHWNMCWPALFLGELLGVVHR